MKTNEWLVLLAVPVLLSGCGANFNSAFRKFDITKAESVSIDAKQRVVTTGQRPGYSGTDAFSKPFQVDTQLVTCAEPSPDALSVLGASFGASAEETQKLALKLAAGTSESGTNIGLRTQTITILRDAMYRLCEGYQGGALSSLGFERLQRRYQNAMLGLLAVEQLTGAVTPKYQVISSKAPSSPIANDPSGDQKQSGGDKPAVDPKALGADQKQAVDGKAAGGSKKPAAEGEKPASDPKVGRKQPVEGKPAGDQKLPEEPTPLVKPISDAVATAVAGTVFKIVEAVLNVDYTRETCLNHLIDETGRPKDAEVIDFCRQLLRIEREQLERFQKNLQSR